MARDAMWLYHRTFRDSPKLVAGFNSRRDAFMSAGARHAFKFVGNNAVETIVFPKRDQNFDDHATDWEKRYSTLVTTGWQFADPVLDKNLSVLGYVGRFTTDQVYVPEDAMDLKMPDALKQKKLVIVSADGPRPHYVNFASGSSEEFVTVFCDPDGNVKAFLGEDIGPGVTSDIIQAYDLVLIGKLVLSLGRKALAGLIAAVAFRGAQEAGSVVGRELTEGASGLLLRAGQRPVGQLSIAEMEMYLNDVLQQRPELGRLMAAKRLTGEALKSETMGALHDWEVLNGKSVKIVPTGTVQARTVAGNLASLSIEENELWIESQVLDDPSLLFKETTHELAADSMGVSGQDIDDLPYLVRGGYDRSNAMRLLEETLRNTIYDTVHDVLGGFIDF